MVEHAVVRMTEEAMKPNRKATTSATERDHGGSIVGENHIDGVGHFHSEVASDPLAVRLLLSGAVAPVATPPGFLEGELQVELSPVCAPHNYTIRILFLTTEDQ